MARGDHPMRTPVYGVLMMAGAMVLGTLVGVWTHPPVPVRDTVWILCVLLAVAGLALSLRDLSPPPRRRR
jgi:uncharacterized membrane protein YfcA